MSVPFRSAKVSATLAERKATFLREVIAKQPRA